MRKRFTVLFGLMMAFVLSLGVAPAQAAGYTFYQGCGGVGSGVYAYLTSGATVYISCGTSRSGVLQVQGRAYSEWVYDAGSSVCYRPYTWRVIRGTGASGKAVASC